MHNIIRDEYAQLLLSMPRSVVGPRFYSDLSNPVNRLAVTLDYVVELYNSKSEDKELLESFDLLKGHVKELLDLLGGYQKYLEKSIKLEE